MPGKLLSTEGFVLDRQETGESYRRYQVLSSEQGLLLCLKRQAVKRAPKSQPDLFDLAALELEQPARSKSWFIREYRLLKRHAAIGRSYEALRYASEFARILVKNLEHLESFTDIYNLCNRAFSSWEAGTRPDVVFFKCLYVFARQEGYAVKQQWLASLDPKMGDIVTGILNRPVEAQNSETETVENLIKELRVWMAGHTDILVPNQGIAPRKATTK